MTRRFLKIALFICLGLIGLLFQPKFHKPPIEFQDRTMRLIIEYSFFAFIGIAVIIGLFLIKNKLLKALYSVFGTLILLIVAVGFFFTWINNGETYFDKAYYRNDFNTNILIYQYYGHGAFGSSERTVVRWPITKKIGWFRLANKQEEESRMIQIDYIDE